MELDLQQRAWPGVVRRGCLAYRDALWAVKKMYFPDKRGQPPLMIEKWPKRSSVARMVRGADRETRRLLHRELRSPSLKAACDNQPLKYRVLPGSGITVPAWSTSPASPVGMEARVWQRLNYGDRLSEFAASVDHLIHVVLWHEFLPAATSTPSIVWDSLHRLHRRYDEFERAVWPSITGGFVMREVDRAVYGSKRGVLVHLHAVYGLRGRAALPGEVWRVWEASAQDGEETTHFESPIPLHDFDQILQYTAGTARVEGTRFAKLLDGFHSFRWIADSPYNRKRLKKQRIKGPTTPEQLVLILAALAYYRPQPRWRKAWDVRSREGRALRAAGFIRSKDPASQRRNGTKPKLRSRG